MVSQADLYYSSNIDTDKVIYTKTDTQEWTGLMDLTYDTGLNDYCFPLSQYSFDNNKWYDQGQADETNNYVFPTATITDDGIIKIPFGSPAGPQILYIRIICLSHPGQKPFSRVSDGAIISYSSSLRYMKIAKEDPIQAVSNGATETALNLTIPHNLGYTPFIRLFIRYNNSTKYITKQLSNAAKPLISLDDNNLYFNTDTSITGTNFIVAPGPQYFYRIYYDNI